MSELDCSDKIQSFLINEDERKYEFIRKIRAQLNTYLMENI